MNNFLSFVLIIILVGACFSGCEKQEVFDNPNSRHKSYCKCQYERKKETLTLKMPQKREEQILDEIIYKTGLSIRPFHLCRAKTISGNTAAFATVFNNKHYIVYDGEYFSQIGLDRARRVLAHEVGHLLHLHPLDHEAHSHEEELEADYFSGKVLFMFGLPYEDAVSLISEAEPSTSTHPPGFLRQQAISDGWVDAAKVETPPQKEASPHQEEPGPVVKHVNYVELTVRDFIQALGRQDFSDAYALQNINDWGSEDYFSSKRSFGGINETKIQAAPKTAKCYKKAGDGSCLSARVYVEYYAKDPVNDHCDQGKTYKVNFWVSKIDESWKITQMKAEDIRCR